MIRGCNTNCLNPQIVGQINKISLVESPCFQIEERQNISHTVISVLGSDFT